MADEELRQLFRRWKETGACADEAAYLSARVRAGELTLERLELAAWLGCEGATAVVSPDDAELSEVALASKRAPIPRKGSADPSRALGRYAQVWDDGLAKSPEASKRALIGMGWAAEAFLRTFDESNSTPREVLEAAEQALLHPGEEQTQDLAAALAALHLELGDPPPSQKRADRLFYALEVLRQAGAVVTGQAELSPAEDDRTWSAARGMGPVHWGLDGLQKALGSGYRGAERAVKAVIDEVRPWALGHGDPLRERVAHREARPERRS